MSYTIAGDQLKHEGQPVDQVPSIFVGSRFAKAPRIAVIHFTFGGTARSSAQWFRDKRNPGSSAHFVIERDGEVIQCVPLDRVAWHAGKSRWRDLVGLNAHSIGIELANWGYLKKSGDGWSCHTGIRIPAPVMARHRNGNPDGSRQPLGWEPYPQAQFDAAVAVTRALVDSFGITEVIGHDDIAPTRKWDPGPAFDMARFRAAVFGGRGEDGDTTLRVSAVNGLNLRSTAGLEQPPIELLPHGTLLEPLASDGNWLQVDVLDGGGAPRATGWVHGKFVEDA